MLVISLINCRSSTKFEEQRILVNFDQEKGRQPHPQKGPDTCLCIIRPAKSIRMAVIQGYLEKKMPFGNEVLEAISEFPRPWLANFVLNLLQASLII